jgi:glycerol-3-phosphate dehydrogenase
VLSVYGGKLTTYRKLAERALEMLAPLFPAMGPAWTAGTVLPGGALPEGGIDGLLAALRKDYSGLDDELLKGLARRHGSLSAEVLAYAPRGVAGSRHFGADLYAFEVDYLVQREWARTVEDVLWRRTKSGLRLDPAAVNAVATYMGQKAQRPT